MISSFIRIELFVTSVNDALCFPLCAVLDYFPANDD